MNKFVVKVILLIVLIGALYTLGYLRNFVFVTINAQSSAIYYHDTKPLLQGFMQFIAGKDYKQLIHLKWALTLIFYLLFFILTVLSIYIAFKNTLYIRLCAAFYGFMLATAFIITITGYLFPVISVRTYDIARSILHLEQSMVPLIVISVISIMHRRGYLQKTN